MPSVGAVAAGRRGLLGPTYEAHAAVVADATSRGEGFRGRGRGVGGPDAPPRPGRTAVDTRGELTPQEAQIARMAGDGHSNQEIGLLFLSNRTVQWHLDSAFAKLGITSRNELAHALGRSGAGLVPA
jgi:DNA-binding NarL/FixJ family response regulator